MDEKITLKDKLQYRIDNMFSRGPGVLIFWLAILSFLVVFTAAVILVLLRISPDGEGVPKMSEALWMSLMRTLDSGTMGGDQGWGFRLMMLFVTLGGIFIISALISVINNGLQGRLEALSQGRSRVIENGHTVILGWNDQVFTIVEELCLANLNQANGCIVIMGDENKSLMEQQVRERVHNIGHTCIVCRTGSPMEVSSLALLSLGTAKSIIILSPGNEDPDAEVLKIVLAIKRTPVPPGTKYHIVAELRNIKNCAIAQVVGGEEVEWLLTEDIVARMVAQTCHQPGLSLIYTDLIDFSGDEIYFFTHPDLEGKTFGEILNLFEKSSILGIKRRGQAPQLNPPMGTLIEAGDQIFLIAEDDNRICLSGEQVAIIDPTAIKNKKEFPKRSERVLVLGWNRHASKILRELDNYLGARSSILVIANIELVRQDSLWGNLKLKRSKVLFRNGITTDRQMLDTMDLSKFSHIIILSYKDYLPNQVADSKTLITLFHLRDISAHFPPICFSIVSEILDVRNRNLAEVSSAEDFIVSDKLISLLISQVSENKALNAVFKDIFNVEGSEIYLKPASIYVSLGRPVNFYTIVESARQKRQVALGYRLAANATDSEKSFGIVLNPMKSSKVQFTEADKIIVLAEE
ncbi:MAG: potassium transporter TrkA [Anaerolineaceae bacterium]